MTFSPGKFKIFSKVTEYSAPTAETSSGISEGGSGTELLIGDMREGAVVAVFSAKGSASPECILEGWARNRFKLQKDGSFINNGSSGAEYSSISRYLVARDGGSTECVETYFTNPGIDASDLIVYRSNSESQDPSAAEKVGSSWDDYEKCCARLEGEEYAVEFTPFSEYKDRNQRLNDEFQNSLKVSGISYVSPDGTSMEMSLSQSGMDGSLVFGRVTIDDRSDYPSMIL